MGSDTENESDKSENESSQYERNAEENRKKRGRESSSDENHVLRKKRRLDSNKFKKGGGNVSYCKKHHIDSDEIKKGGGNVNDHLTWSERRKLAQFFKYAFSVPMIRYFNQSRHLFVPPIISNNIIKNNILPHDKDTTSRLIHGSKVTQST